jgi:flagellar basal-body rod modification protein FlgD
MAAASPLTHHTTASQALMANRATPMDSSSGTGSSSSSSASDSATISANDFLSLLVTEMQNQDPTADTDPNEYVNQLVQVNSLEQLININQTLTGAFDPSSSTSDASTASTARVSPQSFAQTSATSAVAAAHPHAAPVSAPSAGNLSVPATSAAAQRVGHALDGHTLRDRAQAAHMPAKPTSIRFPRTF